MNQHRHEPTLPTEAVRCILAWISTDNQSPKCQADFRDHGSWSSAMPWYFVAIDPYGKAMRPCHRQAEVEIHAGASVAPRPLCARPRFPGPCRAQWPNMQRERLHREEKKGSAS